MFNSEPPFSPLRAQYARHRSEGEAKDDPVSHDAHDCKGSPEFAPGRQPAEGGCQCDKADPHDWGEGRQELLAPHAVHELPREDEGRDLGGVGHDGAEHASGVAVADEAGEDGADASLAQDQRGEVDDGVDAAELLESLKDNHDYEPGTREGVLQQV